MDATDGLLLEPLEELHVLLSRYAPGNIPKAHCMHGTCRVPHGTTVHLVLPFYSLGVVHVC